MVILLFSKVRGRRARAGRPTIKCRILSMMAASMVPEPNEYIP